MRRRFSTLFLAVVLFLVACSPSVEETPSPSETALPPVTETSVPTTQPPTLEPVMQTATSQTALTTDWLSQLEIIQAGNWSRLQLLKTFPAEMPLRQSAVAISPDGKTLAVGSREGAQVFFFDIESGQLLWSISMGISNVGAYFNIMGMEYLPDGTLMANSSGPYAIYHMDTDGNILAKWDGINFALSADKKVMAHNDDAGLTLVDIASNSPLVSLEGGNGMDYSFSPDGTKIAVEDVGVDYIHTTIWDVPSKSILAVLDEAAAPRYSPDGKFLAAIYYDDENDKAPLKIFSPDGVIEIIALNGSGGDTLINRSHFWAVDGSVIAAFTGSPIAWNTATWELLDAPALQGEPYSFSPDGRILITRTLDGGILLWGVVP